MVIGPALARALNSVAPVSMSKVWQYNGVAPAKDILSWCEQNIAGGYHYNQWETIFFTPEAYTLFLLRWA